MAKNSLFSSRPYGVWDRMGTTTSLHVYIDEVFRYNNIEYRKGQFTIDSAKG